MVYSHHDMSLPTFVDHYSFGTTPEQPVAKQPTSASPEIYAHLLPQLWEISSQYLVDSEEDVKQWVSFVDALVSSPSFSSSQEKRSSSPLFEQFLKKNPSLINKIVQFSKDESANPSCQRALNKVVDSIALVNMTLPIDLLFKYPKLQQVKLSLCALQLNEDKAGGQSLLKEFVAKGSTGITPELLERIIQSKFLTALQLDQCKAPRLTDKSASIISKAQSLDTLSVAGSGLTNDSVKKLSSMRTVTNLDISGTNIGDDGIASVGTMRQLKQLDLSALKITTNSLSQLTSLIDLQSLKLRRINLSQPNSLLSLKNLPSLNELDLSNSELSDESLPVLLLFQNLTKLSLIRTPITLRGLKAFLDKCKSTLQEIYVSPSDQLPKGELEKLCQQFACLKIS